MQGELGYPIVVWKHQDGREIHVYHTHKIRRNFLGTKAGTGQYDAWPILYRSEVPALTDDEWVAAPVEAGWVRV